MKKTLINLLIVVLIFAINFTPLALASDNTMGTSARLNFFAAFFQKITSFFDFGFLKRHKEITPTSVSTSTSSSIPADTSSTQQSIDNEVSDNTGIENNDHKKEIEKLKKEIEDLKNKANQSTTKPTSQVNAASGASTEGITKQKDESYKIISLNITPNFDSAHFEWATTFPSESKIFFWEDGNSLKNFSQSSTGISFTHLIDLKNLLTDTKYCFQIEAIADEGATTTEGCFKTLPVNDWVIKASNLNPNKSCSELAHALNNEEEIKMCEAYFKKYKK